MIAGFLVFAEQVAFKRLCQMTKKYRISLTATNFLDSFFWFAEVTKHSLIHHFTLVPFRLNPKEIEFDPYVVLRMVNFMLKKKCLYWPAIHAFLGCDLRDAVLKLMKRGHEHRQFHLITLPIAALTNCTQAVQFLLSHPTPDDPLAPSYFCFALKAASMAGYNDVVNLLLHAPLPYDPGVEISSSLCVAVREGRLSTVRILLTDPRINPAYLSNSPVISAAFFNYLDILNLLLATSRVNIKARFFESFRNAHVRGDVAVLQILLDHFVAHPGVGLGTETRPNPELVLAASKGQVDVVRRFLYCTKVGKTPAWRSGNHAALRAAHTHRHQEIVDLLLVHLRKDPGW